MNDYVIETQAVGMFYSTTTLSEKGNELRNKLITKYPTYLDLLKDSSNPNSKSYKSYMIKFQEIKFDKINKTNKSSKINKTDKISKSNKLEKINKSNKINNFDKKIINNLTTLDIKNIKVNPIKTKFLDTDSDTDSDT
jgi:hypothetical protein